jgi:hypothetical protein
VLYHVSEPWRGGKDRIKRKFHGVESKDQQRMQKARAGGTDSFIGSAA